MDLFTASTRLQEHFRLDGEPRKLADHGLVGDGYSCALIGVDGSIGWMCLPHFDSPSVFGQLLDPENGGTCRVAPAREGATSQQAYDNQTAVLQTLFHRPGDGTGVVTDFMPWGDESVGTSVHELHRLLEVREGSLEMEVLFDPRFDYGRGETTIEITSEGAIAHSADGQRMSISVSGGFRFEPHPVSGVVARARVHAGQRAWVILSWRSKRPEPVAAHRPFEQLRRTRRSWREWVSRLTYDGPWRHDVMRSAITLKLLQFQPSGAMVAAATTSLPAWLGGNRNWDYRFSWTRDSAMALRAMNLIGFDREADRFFHFVRDCVDRRGKLDIMVSIAGDDVAQETELPHWGGHRDSLPVRIGNAAAHQIQHDITGPLLDAALVYERTGGILSLRVWREIRHLVDRAVESIEEPDHGIWEPRAEPVHHVHSKLMTWVALDRALKLAPLFGGDREERIWARACSRLRFEILEQGYNPHSQTFIGSYGEDDVDATLLLIPIYGFLPASDPRVSRTIDRVMKELGEGRYLRRYTIEDGIGCPEGAFALCGFWLAEALALAGRLDEALEVFHNHAGAANHVGLIAEEIHPNTGEALGNFPQAFSHLGLIQAAARLDLALRLRDEGAEAPPFHALEEG